MEKYQTKTQKSLSLACHLFGYSRQAYYKRKHQFHKDQELQSQVISLVNTIRMYMPRIGTRKLYYMLEKDLNNINVGRDKLFKILRINNMLVRPKKSYHVTTNSKHWLHKHKNHIQNLNINRPEQVWVSDITYIKTKDGHNYLSLVTDAYSKKIMGYYLSKTLHTEGCLKAMKMAIKNRIYKKTIIHHSDRGLQYCSEDYQKLLQKYNIKPSMTENYDPYQNAIAERVNGILKNEFLLAEIIMNRDIAKMAIKDCISIYNNLRPHYSCEYLTPTMMHEQSILKRKSYKKN